MQAAHERGDFEEEAAIDVEFHNAIGECAHNIMLLHTLRSCYRLLSDGVFHNRLMVFALPGAREELLAQHRAIHDAVAAGDPEAARAASVQAYRFHRARHGGGRALRRLAARLAAEAQPAVGRWGCADNWQEDGEPCYGVAIRLRRQCSTLPPLSGRTEGGATSNAFQFPRGCRP